MNKFNHLIEIDSEKRELVIYRVDEGGNKVLYTSTELPELDFDNDIEKFKEFAGLLGENILLDSPEIRKLYNL